MLTEQLEKIEQYTHKHPELWHAHHWLFDLVSPKGSSPRVAILGLNPGESATDWKICPRLPDQKYPTEETSRFDFHDADKNGREKIRWVQMSQELLKERPYVQSEIFFWSSNNIEQLEQRYGRLQKSPHLGFCRDMNIELFENYSVNAVICVGINNDRICSNLYTLGGMVDEFRVKDRLVAKLYHDGTRHWLFTLHWTGARSFTKEVRDCIGKAIDGLLPT